MLALFSNFLYSRKKNTNFSARWWSVPSNDDRKNFNKKITNLTRFKIFSFSLSSVESCSAMDFNNCTTDPEFISKLKATNSSYCLMRHNRSVNQLRSSERSSSGASNVTFNFSSNSGNSSVPDKSTETTTLSSNSRKQMVWHMITFH